MMGDEKAIDYLVCQFEHSIPFVHNTIAKDFSDGDTDMISGLPMYEFGLYCHKCELPYGFSKLHDPSDNVITD